MLTKAQLSELKKYYSNLSGSDLGNYAVCNEVDSKRLYGQGWDVRSNGCTGRADFVAHTYSKGDAEAIAYILNIVPIILRDLDAGQKSECYQTKVEEIDKLVGRELDAAVAVRVFGRQIALGSELPQNALGIAGGFPWPTEYYQKVYKSLSWEVVPIYSYNWIMMEYVIEKINKMQDVDGPLSFTMGVGVGRTVIVLGEEAERGATVVTGPSSTALPIAVARAALKAVAYNNIYEIKQC